MSCRAASRLISASLDRALTPRERISLRFHLLCCGACRRFRNQVRLLRAAVQKLDERARSADGSLSDDARERIRRTISGA